MARCPNCFASCTPSDWPKHLRQFHSSSPRLFHCSDCDYGSDVFTFAIGHSFLEGHSISWKKCLRTKHQWTQVLVLAASSDHENQEKNTYESGNAQSTESAADDQRDNQSEFGTTIETLSEAFSLSSNENGHMSLSQEESFQEGSFNCQQFGGSAKYLLTSPEDTDIAPVSAHSKEDIETAVHDYEGGEVELKEGNREKGATSVEAQENNHSEWDAATMEQQSEQIRSENSSLHMSPTEQGSTVPGNKLKCQQCGSSIKYFSKRDRSNVADHVRKCIGIRPFGCSSCGFKASQSGSVKRHIKRGHKGGAKLVHLDREQNKAAAIDGMQRCFPALR